MVVGSSLRSRDEQYLVSYDSSTRVWRILDTWNTDLTTLDVEDEVPDDHSSVTIITEGQFIAIVKEATAAGVLEAALQGASTDTLKELKDQVEENVTLKQESENLQKELDTTKADFQDRALELQTRYNSEKENSDNLRKQIDELKETLTGKDKQLLRSESYALKVKALETISKLTISEDISKIVGDNEA